LAVSMWNQALVELANWMVATKMHQQLQQEILARLKWWHDYQPPTSPISDGSPISILQAKIGWGWFLKDAWSNGGKRNRTSSGKHSKGNPGNPVNDGQWH